MNSQRLQVWGRSLSWNAVLEVLREVRPQKEWLADLPTSELLGITVDQTLSEKVLNKFGNREWIPLEQTLTENLNSPYFKYSVGV
jgi:hypothetical protein